MDELVDSLMERLQNFSIELDCPPGWPRPDDLFPNVIAGTGFIESDFENVGNFFGNWTWILKEEVNKDELYTKIRETKIKPKIELLYNNGRIRYGSW